MGVSSYHLATDCGLEGINQLSSNPDEIVIVCLDFIKALHVGHAPAVSFHELLMKLLQHFYQEFEKQQQKPLVFQEK